MPKQLGNLAWIYGIQVESTVIAPGGASLSKTKERAIEAMQNEHFDYAVFQDYGTRPSLGNAEFMQDIRMLCVAAKASGAAAVLYNPAWAHIDGEPDTDRQRQYTEAYAAAAKENGALLVNAGDAWVYAYRKLDGLSLYQSNDYHATTEGAYLTACVFASTLLDLHIKDVDTDNLYCGKNALPLGLAAWEFVSYYKANEKAPDGTADAVPGTNQRIN